jgi:hypothetical protein
MTPSFGYSFLSEKVGKQALAVFIIERRGEIIVCVCVCVCVCEGVLVCVCVCVCACVCV